VLQQLRSRHSETKEKQPNCATAKRTTEEAQHSWRPRGCGAIMAVYFKFNSWNTANFDTISLDSPFISVGELKQAIFKKKKLEKNTGLVLTNAQTNEGWFMFFITKLQINMNNEFRLVASFLWRVSSKE
jgi:hypothetical protein